MTAVPSPQDQEIIEILGRLATFKEEYPPELLAARRAAFIARIEEQREVGEKEELPSEAQVAEALGSLKKLDGEYPPELLAARREAFLAQVRKQKEMGVGEKLPSEAQVAEALGSLKKLDGQYPPELLAARRAAFLSQVKHQKEIAVKDNEELPSREQVLAVLDHLKTARAEYPPDLLAARRAAFLAQIEQHNTVEVVEEAPVQSTKLVSLFDRLKSIEIEYPLKLWTARRAAFLKQLSWDRISILDALRSAFRNIVDQWKTPQAPTMKLMRSSLVLASILLAAFAGALLYGRQGSQLLSPVFTQTDISQPVAATSSAEAAEVICKPGYLPPLCLAQESTNKNEDLTYAGNGSARPAVAKDTIPGYSDIHRPAYINDGLYGAGASWISNSPYSWIKIDLGKPTMINTITFGRDRLGNYNDRDPGQFVIAVALHDDVYADGNSSNDYFEYTKVYDSKETGFDGVVSGSETIQASFAPVEARFVKITFENAGTAVDEVEAFMVQPPSLAYLPTQKARDNQPRSTWTPIPTNTLIRTDTPTPFPTETPLPTSTPTDVPPTSTPTDVPTSTPTDVPTSTPRPTNTPTDVPTSTPRPTNTPTPRPTNTPTEIPTNTPRPTSTPTPRPTSTPTDVPPTSAPTNVPPTNTPYPTDTPFPTDTAAPPTNTPFVPASTSGPASAPTDTPIPPVGP